MPTPAASAVLSRHTHAPRYGQHVPGCPRCAELKAGAPPVRGWKRATRYSGSTERDSRNHSCAQSACGPVCTFGDW